MPLSFINSETFSFKSEMVLLFLKESSSIVLVISREVPLIVLVTRSSDFFVSS